MAAVEALVRPIVNIVGIMHIAHRSGGGGGHDTTVVPAESSYEGSGGCGRVGAIWRL